MTLTTKYLSVKVTDPILTFRSDGDSADLIFDGSPSSVSICLPDGQVLYVDDEEEETTASVKVILTSKVFDNDSKGFIHWYVAPDVLEILLSAHPKMFDQILDLVSKGLPPREISLGIKDGMADGKSGRFTMTADEYEITSWSLSLRPV